jgi:hypothetical protein
MMIQEVKMECGSQLFPLLAVHYNHNEDLKLIKINFRDIQSEGMYSLQ